MPNPNLGIIYKYLSEADPAIGSRWARVGCPTSNTFVQMWRTSTKPACWILDRFLFIVLFSASRLLCELFLDLVWAGGGSSRSLNSKVCTQYCCTPAVFSVVRSTKIATCCECGEKPPNSQCGCTSRKRSPAILQLRLSCQNSQYISICHPQHKRKRKPRTRRQN